MNQKLMSSMELMFKNSLEKISMLPSDDRDSEEGLRSDMLKAGDKLNCTLTWVHIADSHRQSRPTPARDPTRENKIKSSNFKLSKKRGRPRHFGWHPSLIFHGFSEKNSVIDVGIAYARSCECGGREVTALNPKLWTE